VVSDDDMEMTYQEFLEGKSTTPHGIRRHARGCVACTASVAAHTHTHAARTHTLLEARMEAALAFVRVVASEAHRRPRVARA
jgi:hypothetical protein